MKIKRFNDINEGVRDSMTPKSEKDILESLLKLTPNGMLYRIMGGDFDSLDDLNEYEEMARERIEEAIRELDEIFENSDNRGLNTLVTDVASWVKKNGGNDVNITDYGFKSLSQQIVSYGFQDRHDAIVIYNDKVFESFKELLREYALCETESNNRDYDN
jgi:ribosomal protein S6